eukprot:3343028-Prymnesium_polylepis.1
MAHSPYEITWALDSNVACCTRLSATAFLQGALATGLWGYDIAHANQRDGAMWPHNFNIVYKWSAPTAAVMRDWFLLQLRRGVATDDQQTLLVAELRYRHVSDGRDPNRKRPARKARVRRRAPHVRRVSPALLRASEQARQRGSPAAWLPDAPRTHAAFGPTPATPAVASSR